ncbi:MAG: potassium-transporting ATPase subunit KdpC [Planctomycetes bacterium]|nr:potassium-transporting ATPase subunit KdpC [Planctomycetota bacterium]
MRRTGRNLGRELLTSTRMLLALTLLTGVTYPLIVWALGQTLFHERANGSLVVVDGHLRGSRLVGQAFDDARWFWGRPSATSPACNGALSGGSNLGPTNPALAVVVRARVAMLLSARHPATSIPVDLVTASGSGLDPHISPAAARFQVDRVAAARGLDPGRVRALVEEHVEPPSLGFLGEARVNVLELNLLLEALR